MAQIDFTTGNIYKQMISFSTPIILTNILQVSYQFIDSIWIGNLLGTNALGLSLYQALLFLRFYLLSLG